MKNIAVFASGSGSNAENIFNYFIGSDVAKIVCFLTNNPKAYVIERAKTLGVECAVFNREQFTQTDHVVQLLRQKQVDYVVLAGFLWLVPSSLIDAYQGRIINIHPALLPSYGGKGMYGDNVHKAVVEAGERESGITIHKVNYIYDSGEIVEQVRVAVDPLDSYEDVAAKVHRLEYENFPRVIEQEIKKL